MVSGVWTLGHGEQYIDKVLTLLEAKSGQRQEQGLTASSTKAPPDEKPHNQVPVGWRRSLEAGGFAIGRPTPEEETFARGAVMRGTGEIADAQPRPVPPH